MAVPEQRVFTLATHIDNNKNFNSTTFPLQYNRQLSLLQRIYCFLFREFLQGLVVTTGTGHISVQSMCLASLTPHPNFGVFCLPRGAGVFIYFHFHCSKALFSRFKTHTFSKTDVTVLIILHSTDWNTDWYFSFYIVEDLTPRIFRFLVSATNSRA